MKLLVSPSPHIRDPRTTSSIMGDVLIALVPACAAGVYFFGWGALITILVSVAAAVITELLCQVVAKRPVTIKDCSAAVTGLLLALTLPPNIAWWIPAIGSAFAIIFAKQVFGGLGHNFMNPALVGRAVLMVSWGGRMANFVTSPDAITLATPLARMSGADPGSALIFSSDQLLQSFIGNIGGCIGETSKLMLLAGGIYLVIRGVISVRIPLSFILSSFVFSLLMSPFSNGFTYALASTLGGGLFLGAIFMATDYSSSPSRPVGQIIYGIGCGLITVLIRVYGSYPEGVSYAILLMNVATPLINRFTAPKPFGIEKAKAA